MRLIDLTALTFRDLTSFRLEKLWICIK